MIASATPGRGRLVAAAYHQCTFIHSGLWYGLGMANRKAPPEEVTDHYVTAITKLRRKRERAVEKAAQAEDDFRTAIREACEAGLTVGPLKDASGLSETRIYQLRDGRRI